MNSVVKEPPFSFQKGALLQQQRASFTLQKSTFYFAVMNSLYNKGAYMGNYLLVKLLLLVRYSPSNLSLLPLLPYV